MKMDLGEELLNMLNEYYCPQTVLCPKELPVCLSVSEVYCRPEKCTNSGVNTNEL
jgi:hypothetical protein